MAQGYKVSEEEQKKIWELHQLGYFPSVIARHLSDRYAHLNGGYRSPETVKDTIKVLEKQVEIMGSAITSELPDLKTEPEPKSKSKNEVKHGRSLQTKAPKTA